MVVHALGTGEMPVQFWLVALNDRNDYCPYPCFGNVHHPSRVEITTVKEPRRRQLDV